MNNSKSLKIIQTLSKIGKVLSKICYVCCLIGVIGCSIGLVALVFCAQSTLVDEGQTLREIVEAESGMSMGALISAVFIGLLVCAMEAVLAKLSEKTFKKELEIGHPFDAEVSKSFRNLGIYTFIVPIVSSSVLGIALKVITYFYGSLGEWNVEDFTTSAELGLFYLLLSVIFQYGAEIKAKADKSDVNE